MGEEWLDFQVKCFERLLALRAAHGYHPIPSPPWVTKLIREMPNLYLDGIKR